VTALASRNTWRKLDSKRSKNWFMRCSSGRFQTPKRHPPSPAPCRVALGKLQATPSPYAALLYQRRIAGLGDLVEQAEDAGFDELDQAFKHLRLAGEMPVERSLRSPLSALPRRLW
jgi:hypothetical protein